MTRATLLFLALFSGIEVARAQYASISLAADGYFGDLNRIAEVNGYSAFAGYTFYFEEYVFVRVQGGLGSFSSEFILGNGTVFPDPIPPGFSPTLYFENRHLSSDISINAELFQTDLLAIYAGIGLGMISSKLYDRAGQRLESQSQTRIAGETFNGLAFTSPVAVGLILFKNSRLQLTIEQQWVFTTTDYLDNIGYAGKSGTDALRRTLVTIRFGIKR